MTPAGWVLVALGPTVPVIAAVAYIKGRNVGRLAVYEDPIGTISVWLYRELLARPIQASMYLEMSRPEEGRYAAEILATTIPDVPDEEES